MRNSSRSKMLMQMHTDTKKNKIPETGNAQTCTINRIIRCLNAIHIFSYYTRSVNAKVSVKPPLPLTRCKPTHLISNRHLVLKVPVNVSSVCNFATLGQITEQLKLRPCCTLCTCVSSIALVSNSQTLVCMCVTTYSVWVPHEDINSTFQTDLNECSIVYRTGPDSTAADRVRWRNLQFHRGPLQLSAK